MKHTVTPTYPKAFVLDYQTIRFLQKEGFSLEKSIIAYNDFLYSSMEPHEDELRDYMECYVRSSCFISELYARNYHIFIDDNNLVSFLSSTGVHDFNGIFELIKLYGFEDSNIYLNKLLPLSGITTDSTSFPSLFLCLYFPNDPYVYYVMLNIVNANQIFLQYILDNTIEKNCIFGSLLLEDGKKESFKNNEAAIPIYNRIINLLFYISAFPDSVKSGVPHKYKFSTSFQNKKLIVKTTDKLLLKTKSNEHGTVIPHFRSGYFKYLGSDFYKNKKGQYIFVESTFVKGHNVKTIDYPGEVK